MNKIELSEKAIKNHDVWFPGLNGALAATDPDLLGIFGNFAFDEILEASPVLELKERILVTLACTIAKNALDEYKAILGAALLNGIKPIEIKELVYQSVAYVGIAVVLPFLIATNEELAKRGVKLPLEPNATTDSETRLQKGQELIDSVFGKGMVSENNVPTDERHIQRFLADNCFGDFQTREGLNIKTRELLTFTFLISLGGCEPQVKGHIKGNVNVGNDRELLIAVVTQLIPYIGYPRALNALTCIDDVIPEK